MDPITLPLIDLLSPSLLLIVPLVALLTQSALALPGVKRLRARFGWAVACAIGIAVAEAQALVAGGVLDGSPQRLLQGVILGALAALGYKGVHETRKLLPASIGGTGNGSGAGPALILWPLVLLPLFLAGGCGDPAFTRYAVAEAGTSLQQAKVAMDECRRDLAVDRQREAELQWKAYVADQADTFAKAVKENPSPEGLKGALAALAARFRDERLAAIERNRERTDNRFRLAEEHFAFAAQILARLDALARKEESVQAQLEHYRALAEQVARQRFGLPPAPGLSETLAPAVLASPIAPAAGGDLAPPAVPAAAP